MPRLSRSTPAPSFCCRWRRRFRVRTQARRTAHRRRHAPIRTPRAPTSEAVKECRGVRDDAGDARPVRAAPARRRCAATSMRDSRRPTHPPRRAAPARTAGLHPGRPAAAEVDALHAARRPRAARRRRPSRSSKRSSACRSRPANCASLVSGCGFGVGASRPGAVQYSGGYVAVDIAGATTYLRREQSGWRVAGATRPPLTVLVFRLRRRPSRDAAHRSSTGTPRADLTVRLSDVEHQRADGRRRSSPSTCPRRRSR